MNLFEGIEQRRSVKHFDPSHRMPPEHLERLLGLARLAPSSFNMQNYRFLVIQDPELRRQLRAVAWDQAQVTDASVLVLMCADLRAHEADPARYWSHAPKPVQDILGPALRPFYEGKPQLIRDEAMRSTGFAGMTLMLAALELGYASCPMVGFDPAAVARLVNLPADYALSFMIAIGRETKPAWPRGDRLPAQETVHYNRF